MHAFLWNIQNYWISKNVLDHKKIKVAFYNTGQVCYRLNEKKIVLGSGWRTKLCVQQLTVHELICSSSLVQGHRGPFQMVVGQNTLSTTVYKVARATIPPIYKLSFLTDLTNMIMLSDILLRECRNI